MFVKVIINYTKCDSWPKVLNDVKREIIKYPKKILEYLEMKNKKESNSLYLWNFWNFPDIPPKLLAIVLNSTARIWFCTVLK